MSGEVERPDPSLRISDADRERVANVLREAAGEGRIDFSELDERLEATYSARVYGDLVPILVDLPNGGLEPVPGAAPTSATNHRPVEATVRPQSSIAIMGSQDRRGVWEIGPTHTAFALMGGVVLDLRSAVFGAPEVVITANAVMGGVDILVNAHTRVMVEGVGIMGDFTQSRDRVEPEFTATSPTVRVKGVALMGGVEVKRKAPPDPDSPAWRRMLGRY